MAGAGLFWEKSTVGWLLVTDLFWEKSTADWWLVSQASGAQDSRSEEASLLMGLRRLLFVGQPN
jgi:hypothetical protein